MRPRFTQYLTVFLYWYAVTFLCICGFAFLIALRVDALRSWAESAIATIVITLVPAALTWVLVAEGASRYRPSVKATVFWSGTAATAASVIAMSVGEDASYLPRWMTSALFPAFIVGGIPFMIIGPTIAYWLGKHQTLTQ
ncbi:hypothetical protein M3484_19645 [Pseudomonas sp. GX19020]|uniref:hypothetical protein n=1 Tax=Pseudomonas sp. GX19020 TaxID=2942277 RepID=UPI0020197087|nr:hypothetical protein [Pseudomonas sp. GX19020]MCL4068781.1 hypothetical protein [Pseudomonas sp. GX19020]